MPHNSRPLRYSSPPATKLRKMNADHRITKMPPRQHATASLTANASRPSSSEDIYRQRDGNIFSQPYHYHDTREFRYEDSRRSYLPYEANERYGRPGYEPQYGARYGYGAGRDGRSWGRIGESQTHLGSRRHEGLHSYDRGDDWYQTSHDKGYGQEGWWHDRRNNGGQGLQYDGYYYANTIQRPVPQQASHYRHARQYRDEASYYGDVPSAASAWQGYEYGYWQGYPTQYEPAHHHARAEAFQQRPPWQGRYGQDQAYVPPPGYPYSQATSRGTQQQHYLTHDPLAGTNLNGNAATFQTKLPFRATTYTADTTTNSGVDQVPRVATASPSQEHRHILKRPTPTAAYYKNSSKQATTCDKPRQLLVVLDLNGTLLHRKGRGGSSFAARPMVKEFIQYLLANHKVMIWSSARPANVDAMCQKLFNRDEHARLVAVWARDSLRIPDHAYGLKVQVYKQLSWVWESAGIQATAPGTEGVWDQSNTVLIDDSMEKAASEPHNLLRLDEFTNAPSQKSSDVLGQVVQYLKTARQQSDVSAFMRSTAFAYDPSTVYDWVCDG